MTSIADLSVCYKLASICHGVFYGLFYYTERIEIWYWWIYLRSMCYILFLKDHEKSKSALKMKLKLLNVSSFHGPHDQYYLQCMCCMPTCKVQRVVVKLFYRLFITSLSHCILGNYRDATIYKLVVQKSFEEGQNLLR